MIKKRLLSIILVLLMTIMPLHITGCTTGNESDDTNSNTSASKTVKKHPADMTLLELLDSTLSLPYPKSDIVSSDDDSDFIIDESTSDNIDTTSSESMYNSPEEVLSWDTQKLLEHFLSFWVIRTLVFSSSTHYDPLYDDLDFSVDSNAFVELISRSDCSQTIENYAKSNYSDIPLEFEDIQSFEDFQCFKILLNQRAIKSLLKDAIRSGNDFPYLYRIYNVMYVDANPDLGITASDIINDI